MSAFASPVPSALDLRGIARAAESLQDDLAITVEGYNLHPRLTPAVVIATLESATGRLIPMAMANEFPGSLHRHKAWMRQSLRELLEKTAAEDAATLGLPRQTGGAKP